MIIRVLKNLRLQKVKGQLKMIKVMFLRLIKMLRMNNKVIFRVEKGIRNLLKVKVRPLLKSYKQLDKL
jgi:hypothetical protein